MCMFVYMCDGFRSHRKKLNGEAHIYMYVCVVFWTNKFLLDGSGPLSFLLELVSRRQVGGFLQDFIQNKLNQDPAFESRPPICEKRGPPPWPQIYM